MLTANGKATSGYSETVADRLVAAGLLEAADRDDAKAVDAALNVVLDRVAAVPPSRPISSCYITPQIECGLNTLELHSLIELLVARGILSAKDVEVLLIKAQGSGTAAYMPANLGQLVNHHAEVLAWQLAPHLRPLGRSIDAKAIAQRNVR